MARCQYYDRVLNNPEPRRKAYRDAPARFVDQAREEAGATDLNANSATGDKLTRFKTVVSRSSLKAPHNSAVEIRKGAGSHSMTLQQMIEQLL